MLAHFALLVLQFGLGFDPTLNMDSMMQSPSHEPNSRLDPVDFTSLSLEPALNAPSSSRHIFAFESGSTWGTSGATGSNDWGVPSTGNAFSNDSTNNGIPSTFLSLSSTNTWGSAVPGLGVSSFEGRSLNGDHTTSAGD